jgi:catechol-2,3-dioxygenase
VDREQQALANGYLAEILSQLLEFEQAVQQQRLPAALRGLYERGAPVFSVGFALPSSMRFVEFLQCVIRADLAVSWELWTADVEGPEGVHVLTGRSTEVWRRQDDGVWKMAYDHASLPVDRELAIQTTSDVFGLGVPT